MEEARILVAEDESIVALGIQSALERLGYSVPAVVSSGEKAIEKIPEIKPDLVLMDIMLRGDMDGVEAAEHIRTHFHIPVIYLTAYADIDTLKRAKITEPCGYILKPFQERDLQITIELALYRYKMRRKVEESEKWLFTTLRSIGDAVIATDPEGRVKFMNSVAQSLTGWEQEEAVGKHLKDIFNIVNENTGEPIESPVERVTREGIVVGLGNHTMLIAKDGMRIPIDDNGAPIKDESDELLGVVLVFRDISGRKHVEKALRESEEKYRALVENASEVIIIAQDGALKFVNSRTVELTGYSKDDLISKPFLEFIHPDDRYMVLERYRKRLMGDDSIPSVYSFRIVKKDGEIRWVSLNAVFIPWEEKPATLSFLSDITEHKKMEAELMKIQKLESIGVLAGGIAHDFNNLLTAVIGNISLAMMYDNPEDKNRRLAEAEKASMQARELTQRLLTFSKGGAPIRKTISIVDLLRDSVSFVLSGSNISCEFSIPDDLWQTEVDEGQISQVINNIVINADQSMPTGGKIKIKAENFDLGIGDIVPLKQGQYVKISIQDHGVGIPKDYLSRIFDPFFTTKHKGSGLGLTTSYSIVKNHGGYITVESEVGVGTTFHIYLPASSKEATQMTGQEEKKPIKGTGRILVVDDEGMINDLVKEMLYEIGYDATVTTDGAEAVELYKEAKESNIPFGAVILDLTMPGGIGGKETLKILTEFDPEVKAIVSSGYSEDPVMTDFKNHGFRGVIVKPYKIKELSEVLNKVIMVTDN